MKITLKKWFLLLSTGIFVGIVCYFGFFLIVTSMNRLTVVDESSNPLQIGKAPKITMQEKWPEEAMDIYYASSSVGMGGRFLAYRFSAPAKILEAYAEEEFKAHWDKPKFQKSEVKEVKEDITSLEKAYKVHLAWFDIDKIKDGLLYDGGGASRPTIWIDKQKNIFYFLMTD